MNEMKVKQGRTQKLEPNLRFPEFWNTSEWKLRPLGRICEILNNRRRPITSNDRENGPYPYYGASGIVDYVNDFIFDERLLLIGEDGAKWGAFEKSAFIAEGKYWVNNHAHVIKTNLIIDTLLENYLNMLDLTPFVTGAAPPKLTLGKLKEISVPVPLFLEEQKKIADCLTSLDDLIAASTEKLEKIKAHKRGVMQQLFPAEGEAIPKIRFPEFRDADKWEEKNLGDIANFFKGKGLPKSAITSNGKHECIHYGELFTDYPEVIKTIKSRTNLKCDGSFLSHENDVLMPTSDVTPNGLAKASCIKLSGIILGGDILVIRVRKSLISGEFLSRYIRYLEDKVLQLVSGTTVFHLYASSIKNLKLCFPSLKEQQKIAACLYILDNMIAEQSRKLDLLNTHKKGLIQQLFPPNEVLPR